MAGFSDLLGSMIENNIPQAGQDRLGNILQDLQASFGNAQGAKGGAQGGAQGAAGDLLGKLLAGAQSTLSQASQNPAQAGGLGAVLGSLLGGGGDSIKGAVGGGALAMLAGVAFKALANASASAGQGASFTPPAAGAGSMPLGLREPVSPTEQQAMNDTARLVIKGMVSISKADGEVSNDEIQRILGKLQTGAMDTETQEWLMSELAQPLNLDAFVAEIPNQEVAAQVYAGSLLAVKIDTEAERDYLRQFAEKTGLSPAVIGQIHHTMGLAA
ncbi:MAG: tellurite resistance TerB family protein [Chromatiaceae bacterium]|nr:tellurite resistance TerB family protein [Chromatiaceae bacterium]